MLVIVPYLYFHRRLQHHSMINSKALMALVRPPTRCDLSRVEGVDRRAFRKLPSRAATDFDTLQRRFDVLHQEPPRREHHLRPFYPFQATLTLVVIFKLSASDESKDFSEYFLQQSSNRSAWADSRVWRHGTANSLSSSMFL